ncbi:MAG: hypothetical protein WDW36_000729 [Sanguina aurantia]
MSFATASSSAPGPSRFRPAPFAYNGRAAAALLPCLAIAAATGGSMVAATLLVGAMVTYLMDALQYREGAFTSAWATLAIATGTFLFALTESDAPVPLVLGTAAAMGLAALLAGMWASLQFRWIQIQYPAVALAVWHVLGLAALVPPSDAPYYLAASLSLLFLYLGRPLPSSFLDARRSAAAAPVAMGGGRQGEAIVAPGLPGSGSVQSPQDGTCAAAVITLLPVGLYIGTHWVVSTHSLHLYSAALLASLPLLYLCLLPEGTWWLLPRRPRAAAFLRKAALGLSLLVALVAFEGRVVFHSFGQYIKLQAPWDWVAVTFALFGSASVALLHQLGAVGTVVDVTLVGSFLLICTTAGALAAGVPFNWLPTPLVGACGLALYYDSRSLREYAVFAVGSFLTGVWFVSHHFGFLDIMLGPSLHLHDLCKLVMAALVPALLVPGLVFAGASPGAVGALLMLQASLLCVMEEVLHSAGFEDGVGEVMYPGYLVLLTSLLGIVAARRLHPAGHITRTASWVLHSLHGAKLSMLLLPEAALVLPTVLLILAVTAPAFLQGGSSSPADSDPSDPPAPASRPSRSSGSGSRSRGEVEQPPAWQGWTHAASIVAAVGLARFALFDLVQWVLSARPSEGLLLGVLLCALAAGLAPFVRQCYPTDAAALRTLATLAVAGVLLLLLQPPLPLRGGARCPRLPLALCPRLWDEHHVPMRGVEDMGAWGTGLSRREHWPRWLLVGVAMAGTPLASGPSALSRSRPARLLASLLAGATLGGYVALEIVPDQSLLQACVLLTSVLVACLVALLQLPQEVSPPLAARLARGLPTPEHSAMTRLFPDSKMQVDSDIFYSTRAALMGLFGGHALLMAFALKLRVGAALRQAHSGGLAKDSSSVLSDRRARGRTPPDPEMDLMYGLVPPQLYARFGSMLQMEGVAGVHMQRLSQEGLAWVPLVGNVATFTAFALLLALNGHLTGATPEAIFMLAPLLLLLSQDPVILPMLGEQQRYFPSGLALVAYLTLTAVMQASPIPRLCFSAQARVFGVAFGGGMQGPMTGAAVVSHPLLFIARNTLLLALTAPSLYLLLHYLWTVKVRNGAALLLCMPLSILPLALSDAPSARALALVALSASLLIFFSMKHVRHLAQGLL